MKATILKRELDRKLNEKPMRSAWKRGVKEYAHELIENIERDINTIEQLNNILLNGADSWKKYSCGSSLIYDRDIAKRLCTPSELKRKDGGRLAPNSQETWLDTQARALYQAARLIRVAAREVLTEYEAAKEAAEAIAETATLKEVG